MARKRFVFCFLNGLRVDDDDDDDKGGGDATDKALTQLPKSTRATPQYLFGAILSIHKTRMCARGGRAHGLVDDDACIGRRSRMFSGRMSAWMMRQSCIAHAAESN